MNRIILRNFSSKVAKFQVFPAETAMKNRALVESIAESQDQMAFYAWHPKKEIPYEFTKPLPPPQERINTSLMREEALDEAMRAHKHEYPDLVRDKLAKITFTTKHRWFPRSRDKKAKKTEMDRPYL
jgi:large subunit ribosomal protein L42